MHTRSCPARRKAAAALLVRQGWHHVGTVCTPGPLHRMPLFAATVGGKPHYVGWDGVLRPYAQS